jgi:hypothetical protein
MSFWDGSRWIDEPSIPAPAAPRSRRRSLRDWLATIPLIVLLPALVSPFVAARAGSASLTAVGVGVAGGQLSVTGQGFLQREWNQLRWDDSADGMPTERTTSDGQLSATITIPTTTLPGDHSVSAVSQENGSTQNNGGGKKSSGTTASGGSVTVEETLANVTVSVTSAPTSAPTPVVTPAPTPVVTPTPTPSATYLFGTLLTDPSRSAQEYAAGVRVVELELGWDNYEPQDGVFNGTYVSQMRQRLATMRAAGLKVVLGAGLQYPPSWAYSYPNSRYVNQFGGTSRELNLTFNATLRAKAQQYLARLQADFDLNSFWAVRVGAGGNGETLYPADNGDGINTNAYWAFDPTAQASSPFPGWEPGQTTYAGRSFTTTDVRTWYDWYVGSLVNGVDWQLTTYRNLGFTGFLQVLLPGQGTRPLDYEKAIAGYLNGAGDGNRTMSRGAAWDRVIAKIHDKRNVVAYVSSLADGSGSDDVCESTDASVALTAPEIGLWSAARWVSYLANQYGLPKNGENPGPSDTNSYGTTMLGQAVAQMKACGFQGLMWAHDPDLYSSTSGISLADYSKVISAN